MEQLTHLFDFICVWNYDTFYGIISDNDKPTVTSSNNNPQVGVSNVELTCTHDSNDVVKSYQWFKDGTQIGTVSSKKYQPPGNAKSDSGFKYQCKVVATYVPSSSFSDELTVTFLCKSFRPFVRLMLLGIPEVHMTRVLSSVHISISISALHKVLILLILFHKVQNLHTVLC